MCLQMGVGLGEVVTYLQFVGIIYKPHPLSTMYRGWGIDTKPHPLVTYVWRVAIRYKPHPLSIYV